MQPASSPYTTAIHRLEAALGALAGNLSPIDETSELYSDVCMTKAAALEKIGEVISDFVDAAIRYANADVSAVNGTLITDIGAEIQSLISVVVAQFERVAEEHRQPGRRSA